MTTTAVATTTQVYQVFIKTTPEQVWEAITTPEFTARYFHGARITVADGQYRSYGPDGAVWGDETVIVLSGLKTLLETGEPLSS